MTDDHGKFIHIRWPPERFFWSILNMPGWKRSGQLPAGVLSDLQTDVPTDIDSLHAVCLPLGDDRVLVCALPRETLSQVDERCLTLTPESVPSSVGADVEMSRLNLLVGEFEPKPLRRSRVRRTLHSATVVLVLGVLVAHGFARRTYAWNALTSAANGSSSSMAAQITARGEASRVALDAEVASARRLSQEWKDIPPMPTAAPTLAQFLLIWPTDKGATLRSLSVHGRNATAAVVVDGDPAPFLSAITELPGWTAAEPRLATTDGLTRVTLDLRRIGDPP